MLPFTSFFRSFFRTVRSSVIDLQSYGSRGETFWKGFRYLYTLSVFLAFLLALRSIAFGISVVPHIDEFLSVAGVAIDELYPKELKLTFVNGTLKTNVVMPYTIDVPPSLITFFKVKGDIVPHLVTIDTTASSDKFPTYQSFALLTEKNLVIVDNNRSSSDTDSPYANFRVTPYRSSPEPLVITRDTYDVAAAAVKSYFVYVKPFFIAFLVLSCTILPFIAGGLTLLGKLLYILVMSLVVWAVSALGKKGLTYGRVYTLSLYGVTAAALYAFVESFFGFHFTLLYTAIYLGIMIAVVLQQPKKAT